MGDDDNDPAIELIIMVMEVEEIEEQQKVAQIPGDSEAGDPILQVESHAVAITSSNGPSKIET